MVSLQDTIASIRDTPIEDIRQRIDESRHLTTTQVEQRQRTDRRQRAVQAATALRHGRGDAPHHPTTSHA